jgi:hypothetical protein
MLRHLYRCAVRLHPSSFRRRFGDEMLYIFDQKKGTRAALGVMLDAVFSLFRQWTLRPHTGIEVSAAPLPSLPVGHIPSFESLKAFRPRASAIINGAVLSVILFCTTVFAIRYSWSHVLNLHIREIGTDWGQQVRPQERSPQERSSYSALLQLDPYVGEYVSKSPPMKISIRIKDDPFTGNRLSLSLADAGHTSFALSPVSPAKFVIVGYGNSYVDFTADAWGRICRLSFVINGNAITARRQ